MQNYIYSSPRYEQDDYGSRTPYGRRSAVRAPTMNMRRGYGPGGPSESVSYNDVPLSAPFAQQQQPQMSAAEAGRRRSMGTLSRGPTPQFRASPLGQERFGPTPQMPPTPMGPGYAMPAMQQQGPAPFAGGQAAPAAPGMAQRSGPPPLTKQQVAKLEKYRSWLEKKLDKDDGTDTFAQDRDDLKMVNEQIPRRPAFLGPISTAGTDHLQQITGMMTGGAPTMRAPGMAAMSGGQQQTPPMTSTATTPPMRAPINPADREKSLRLAYGTAGRSLDENPTLGTTPMQPRQTPAPERIRGDATYGGRGSIASAADQVQRNQAAEQRGLDAKRIAGVQRNADQFAQNQGSNQAIAQRGREFERGDYTLSNPTGGAAQLAQQSGQAPATQPAQQPTQQAAVPDEAIDAAQQLGGTVSGADGTMSLNGVRYVFTTINGQAGWKRAG